MVTSTTKAWGTGIIITLLIAVIIYAIIIFELFKSQTSIFAPYMPPTPPSYYFFPLGSVRPMSQEEIDQRNATIHASTGTAP